MISAMRQNRIFKKLTLDDLFLRTRINISRLSRIERKIFKPTEQEKKLIAIALKRPLSKIFPEK